jgi:CRP-like cAMP-binding protein
LISLFYPEESLESLMPYLRSRSLLGIFRGKSGIRREWGYVLYASAAMAWIVAFGLFALSLLTANVPALAVAVGQGLWIDRVSALGILASLGLVLASVGADLCRIVFLNFLDPLLTPLFVLLRSFRSRDLPQADAASLARSLRSFTVFEDLSDESLAKIASQSRLRRYPRSTRVIVQDTAGEEMFVMLKGEVHVVRREATGLRRHLATLRAPSIFGEMAVLEKCQRTADVIAAADVELLVVPKAVLDESLQNERVGHAALLDRIAVGQYLSASPLFRELPVESLQLIAREGLMKKIKQGDFLTREGEYDKSLWLILRGRVEVLRASERIAELRQGEFFGEIALIADIARTASVRALEDSLCLQLQAPAFWRILSENFRMALGFETLAEERFERAS